MGVSWGTRCSFSSTEHPATLAECTAQLREPGRGSSSRQSGKNTQIRVPPGGLSFSVSWPQLSPIQNLRPSTWGQKQQQPNNNNNSKPNPGKGSWSSLRSRKVGHYGEIACLSLFDLFLSRCWQQVTLGVMAAACRAHRLRAGAGLFSVKLDAEGAAQGQPSVLSFPRSSYFLALDMAQ